MSLLVFQKVIAPMRKASSIAKGYPLHKQRVAKILRDNPILNRFIEVGTKALRRGLMSGETLRAPRQQLRRLRASAFDLSLKSPAIARLSSARRVPGFPCEQATAIPSLLLQFLAIRKSVQLIRKNLTSLVMRCGTNDCVVSCLITERRLA